MPIIGEIWKAVPLHKGYEVSNKGRLKSLDREVLRKNRWGELHKHKWKGRIVKLIEHRGYLTCKLGSPSKFYGIHHIVMLAFVGPKPEGLVVNHIDGNKHNNCVENLEYITNTENVKHAYRTGLLNNNGENNGKAKLNDTIVRHIRSTSRSVKPSVLALKLGVSAHNVRTVRRVTKYWGHIEENYPLD